jgi:hypothetical protein
MSDEAQLTAAFDEIETGIAPTTDPVIERVDYAKELEVELEAISIQAEKHVTVEIPVEEEQNEDVADNEAAESVEQTTMEELQQRLQAQARANFVLLAKVRKYDGYIKRLIQMVETLGGRLKEFGLDHYC